MPGDSENAGLETLSGADVAWQKASRAPIEAAASQMRL